MKALKTVAVALGITLAALIVIPLAVLAGLFVWLKVTEEDDEEILELDQEASDRHRADHRPERDARRTGGRRTVRAGGPDAVPVARRRADRSTPATAGSPSSACSS